MKLHSPSAVCAGLVLVFSAATCFAQNTAPATDTAAPSKARKVAQSSVPTTKGTAARAAAKQQSTPATSPISPVEERRFQNCHGKESDA
jgi:hypothetical protein